MSISPSSTLEPNLLEPLTHALSSHLLQLDPQNLILMLESLDYLDLGSLGLKSGILLLEDE